MDEFLNKIHQGDCVAGMNSLAAGSIDLSFADPPFNIGYDYDVYQDKLGRQKYLDWSREWISAVHRVLKPTGTFWLAIGDEYAAELKILSQDIGFQTRSWVIWYYTFGVNCKFKFTRSHAHLFYFVKDPSEFTFRSEDLENRIPSARELVYNDKRANPKGRLPDDTWIIRPSHVVGEIITDDGMWSPDDLAPPSDDDQTWTLRPQDLENCFQADEDTWYFPRVAGTFKERQGFHGCQMPEQLLGRIIRSCSEEGETVLDPFSGSATTLAVAKKLNRRSVGFELSEDYVTYGRSRLDGIRIGDRLDGSAEPTKSAPKTKRDNKKSKKNSKQNAVSSDRFAETQLKLTLDGVVAAFRETHTGYSADRVIVDPEINEDYLGRCQELGLAGDSRTWNTLLFRLRKAGKLSHIETTRSTNISWSDVDPYFHASEIALQSLLDDDLAASLDEILCDPLFAAEFDQRAMRIASDRSPFELRWAALKLRKQTKIARTRGAILAMPRRIGKAVPLSGIEPQDIPRAPGVYLLKSGKKQSLYAGETLDLRQRIQNAIASAAQLQADKEVTVQIFPTQSKPNDFLAWQSCFVSKHRPSWNYQELRREK